MSVFTAVVIGLLMGVVFGFAFEKSRMIEPGMLIGQFQFRRFTMLKMLLAAVATSLVLLAILNGLGLVAISAKAALVGNMVVGGLLLGVGIVLTGACPGTAMAQLGAGYRDPLAIIAGGLVGAAVYGYNQKAIDSALDWSGVGLGNWGKLTFADLLPGGFPVLALIMAAILVAAMVGLERAFPWKAEIEKDAADTDAGRPIARKTDAKPARA